MLKRLGRLGRLGMLLIAGIMMLAFSSVALAAPNDVRAGSQGEDVRQVQQWLIEKGYFDGEADGICGEDTVKAIKHFQVDNDLEADGICGRMTRAKLNPNAQDYTSGRPMMVEATAYSAYDPGNGMYTCMGTLLKHGIIAVDPGTIPLGTRVYIPGYGEAVAEDQGWGIRGAMIDIAFDTHEEALAFGRQYIEIYILD
ncbi:MAG: peptidoglycan-binding protein [Selenomonadaceae bacterium]